MRCDNCKNQFEIVFGYGGSWLCFNCKEIKKNLNRNKDIKTPIQKTIDKYNESFKDLAER